MSRITPLVWEEKVRAVEGQKDFWVVPVQCGKQSLEVHRRDNSFEGIQISVLTQLQWFQLSHVGKSNIACGVNSLWDLQNG